VQATVKAAPRGSIMPLRMKWIVALPLPKTA
jgi:hypothetical protein